VYYLYIKIKFLSTMIKKI